tara:strand:+ start:851 stop:1018 length:168 start_codon:yes stop_codon:yes gene_type:complete
MRIQDMSKAKLIEQISLAEKKLANHHWIRNTRRWRVGVMINHLGKLREELKSRDT